MQENKQMRSQTTTAAVHEQRVKLHTKISLTQNHEIGLAVSQFFEFASTLINKDKIKLLKAVFLYPVKTNELTGEIFEVFSKAFDGRDPIRSFEFTSDEYKEDFENYLQSCGEPDNWRITAFNALKTAFNSVWVVDLPQEQNGTLPEPYYYFLDIQNVIDFDCDKSGNITHIQFKPNKDTIAFFDTEYYRLFKSESKEIKKGDIPEVEVRHELGSCPANFFWSDFINADEKAVKESPITKALNDLDWYLFYSLSKRVLDTYGSWPIYWGFAEDCSFHDEQNDIECVDGYLCSISDGAQLMEGSSLKRCYNCSKSNLAGAGSYIEVDPPSPANDGANLRDPVGIVSIDRASLDYNSEEVQRLREQIFKTCTGFTGDAINNQAVNEKQVLSLFESGEKVIKNIARNLEKVEKQILETIAKLRYGSRFISLSLSYGTKFNLVGAEHLLQMYHEARKEGAASEVLDRLEDEYFETKYKNNNKELQRAKIIANLDPFRHKTGEQVKELFELGLIEHKDFLVKFNLSTYIKRFERENISLLRFGELIDFKTKIERIKDALYSYVPEVVQGGGKEDLTNTLNAYGVAVRAGALTPQQEDEINFRTRLNLPSLSEAALEAWKDDDGVRKPITLKSKTEEDLTIDKLEE